MPSALETLVKILKLERNNGYKNTAVIGGLSAYAQNWRGQAHEQARRPEHHILVDELVDIMNEYEAIENRNERHTQVTYMLDRITGRVQPPAGYQARLSEYQEARGPTKPKREKVEAAPKRKTEQRQSSQRKRENRAPRVPKEETPPDNPNYEDDWIAPPRRTTARSDVPPQPRLARPPRKPREEVDPAAAASELHGLNAPVTKIKGVGPGMATSLKKLGIETINDMLFFLPRRYDDYTRLRYISQLQPGQVVTVIGTVRQTQVRVGRGGRKDFYMELDDGSGILSIVFFGQHFLVRSVRKGKQIVVSGKTSQFRDRLQMTSPDWEPLDSDNLHTVGIVPVYPLTEGLSARKLRSLMKSTVDYWANRVPDYVPEATLDRAELADLGWTIKNLHFPDSDDHLVHARRRYIFDQLLLLQLSILANRREWQAVPGQPLQIMDEFVEGFIERAFPYEMTGAQRRAIDDTRRDMSKNVPMNRLLQGDVGSGKTAVATAALAMAFSNSKQAAMMAPTSILAEQHYRSLTATFERMDDDYYKPVIALLTGALTQSERESVYRGLTDGSIDIVVGTHAIIQEGVQFHDLALAIIDEQHRFGVEQRGALRGKGMNPHLLVMTATPIPRTLALTLYADLDLSIMDEMPPGRTPIETRVVQPVERERIYSFVESQLNRGRQAFIVYPLVEASDSVDALAATDAFDHISQVFFRHRVGLLHGRMKPQEKDEIMGAFAAQEFDMLVTTAVVEVGVDIPNASLIVIEGANRFGLAQLHQFRGRVGRGGYPSYCLLIPDRDTPEAEERLKAMEDTTDGFKLAEIDWQMRGAGDLVGTRQSGKNTLQLMDMMKPELVELSQREARTIYEEDAYLEQDEHRLLKQRVDMLYNEDADIS
jgi:ATP-dependent DNA helicase RecG